MNRVEVHLLFLIYYFFHPDLFLRVIHGGASSLSNISSLCSLTAHLKSVNLVSNMNIFNRDKY